MSMASPDYSDGCMIALYPPPEVAEKLAVDGGLPPDEMHVTVAYLGNADVVNGDQFREVAEELAARKPIEAQISGLARFTGGDKGVIVALIDSADLEDLRRDTLAALADRGMEVPRDHGYCAHMTVTYIEADEPSPLDRLEAVPAKFSALAAVHGADRTDTPLEHPMSGPAREAFAAGWAVSGGPMTERVKAASTAAVHTAIEHADDPRILEVTIDLGKLEGMWALLFQRREEQQAKHVPLVGTAWRNLADRGAAADMVDRFRQHAGLAEADQDKPNIRAEALAAAKSMLNAIAAAAGAGWDALRTTLRDAIAAGRAEGMVNAVAIAAERASQIGLDWNIAFDDAYRSLERLDEIWTDTDGWLARTIDRAAADLGRVLAQGAEGGASREEMIDAAMDILTSGDSEAVAFVVDWAMTTAADQGALSLYQSEGVQGVSWLTAGDGRVCPTCIDNEAGSPWPITDFPLMPSHPVCRCVPAADVSLAHFATWFT